MRKGKTERGNVTFAWYSPSYSMNIITNITEVFFSLIDKHFPKKHKSHKMFNRNNVKISCSCKPNIESVIKSHNKQILYGNLKRKTSRSCNCPDKAKCPFQGNCLTKGVAYQRRSLKRHGGRAKSKQHRCIHGIEGEWKGRSYVHTYNFRNRDKPSSTQMSRYVWITDIKITRTAQFHIKTEQKDATCKNREILHNILN